MLGVGGNLVVINDINDVFLRISKDQFQETIVNVIVVTIDVGDKSLVVLIDDSGLVVVTIIVRDRGKIINVLASSAVVACI